jgi:hypothetical protein
MCICLRTDIQAIGAVGGSNRSIEDMKLTHDNWDYAAMQALEVQHKLNF